VLRHLELTSDPDKPELFRKENRKQVEHFLRTYLKVDGVLILRMVALHAGVMYCTEITDALWKRYLSQHPENLIDDDSSLIHFARTQSIRRTRNIGGGSAGSLQPNHNGSHQRLSRFLSYRQSGSFRFNRGQSGSRSVPKKSDEASRSPSPKEGPLIGGKTTGRHFLQISTTLCSHLTCHIAFVALFRAFNPRPKIITILSYPDYAIFQTEFTG
jgi:hypothetical protein